jgi:hypothetical protein
LLDTATGNGFKSFDVRVRFILVPSPYWLTSSPPKEYLYALEPPSRARLSSRS